MKGASRTRNITNILALIVASLLTGGCLTSGEQTVENEQQAPIGNSAPRITGSASVELTAGENYSFTPTVTDADNDTLSFTISGLPSWANFNSSTGQISGSPQEGDVGIYMGITIVVSDGQAQDTLGPFTVTVVSAESNSAPVISGSAPSQVTVGSNYSFMPTASDADQDTLSFSIAGLPSWASFNNSTGQLSGTPQAGNVGSYSGITITVSDGQAQDTLGPFTITVVGAAGNSAPTIGGNPPSEVTAGDNYAFTPTATDADNDVLSFTIGAQPSWANFNSSNGQLSGTPQEGDVGTYAGITITVSDGQAEDTLGPFAITVVAAESNSAPVISGTAPSEVTAGDAYAFTPTATDADNDVLSFTIEALPSWASFNESNGQISGTPQDGDVGTYSGITITVSDGQAGDTLGPFDITVLEAETNSAPVISGTAPSEVTAGDNYTFSPTATDADEDPLSFTIEALPSWANFNESNGQVSGTPQEGDVGTYSGITITVSDGQAEDTLGPFEITVQAVSLGSVSLSWTAPTQNEDGSTLTDLDGYKIYWGTEPGNYPNSVTIENESVTTYVVENLSPGSYEFVATSFNTSGVESSYSNPATKVVQ